MQPDPLVRLTEFQQEWILDRSRFKLAVKSRRIGFTFAATLEIALDMIEKRTRWLMISRTQEASKEGIAEVRNHLAAMRMVEESQLRIEEIETDQFFHEARITKFRIELPNGSECLAMTAHPDAARGFGGHVFLDEHAFHDESKDLWKSVSAAVLRGHRIVVVSTPNYQQGNYYELARKCGATLGRPPAQRQNGLWSTHWVDIQAAAPELAQIGVSVDIEELRELSGDAEAFEQEYGCQFLSSSEMWIPLELIAAARSALANREWIRDRHYEGNLFVGMDIGRRRDKTVIWIDEVVAGVAVCQGVITLERTPFEEQYRVLREVLSHSKLRRAAIDETGIGMALAERAQTEFGHKVEPVTFNLGTKQDMSVRVRRRFEEKLDKIPLDAPAVERALAAVKREATVSGALRFDAPRTEAGHADEYWAKALADMAQDQSSETGPPDYVSTGAFRAHAAAGAY